MTDFLTGNVVPPGAGIAGRSGLKASQRSTGGALSVFETTIEAGPPLHVHDRDDECFYVLGGELSIRCGSDTFDATAGSFVFLPRGRPHRFWAKDQPARLPLITVPGGIEDYFHRSTMPQTTKSATGSLSTTAFASYRNEPTVTVTCHPRPALPVAAATIPP